MRADELVETSAELDAFVQDVFASLPRADQRNKGSLYLHGLMLDGRRKSMQPMGGRLGVDYQQLQQFVSSSPWKVEPVRRVLVRKAVQLIDPDAWVVNDTGFRKTAVPRPVLPGSIRALRAKSATARSPSVFMRPLTRRRVRWIGACSCPSRGMTPARTRTSKPPRSRPAGLSADLAIHLTGLS